MDEANDQIELDDALAIASEHGGILTFRYTGEWFELFILTLDPARGTSNADRLVAIDVEGTKVLLAEAKFRELVDVASYIRPILSDTVPREGTKHLQEMLDLAEQIGGAVGFRCWLGADEFEPVLVRITRSIGDGVIEIELGHVELRARECDFDRLVEERLDAMPHE